MLTVTIANDDKLTWDEEYAFEQQNTSSNIAFSLDQKQMQNLIEFIENFSDNDKKITSYPRYTFKIHKTMNPDGDIHVLVHDTFKGLEANLGLYDIP